MKPFCNSKSVILDIRYITNKFSKIYVCLPNIDTKVSTESFKSARHSAKKTVIACGIINFL